MENYSYITFGHFGQIVKGRPRCNEIGTGFDLVAKARFSRTDFSKGDEKALWKLQSPNQSGVCRWSPELVPQESSGYSRFFGGSFPTDEDWSNDATLEFRAMKFRQV